MKFMLVICYGNNSTPKTAGDFTVDLSVLTIPLLYIIKNCSSIYTTLGVYFGMTIDS